MYIRKLAVIVIARIMTAAFLTTPQQGPHGQRRTRPDDRLVTLLRIDTAARRRDLLAIHMEKDPVRCHRLCRVDRDHDMIPA